MVENSQSDSRRNFLSKVWIGLGGVALIQFFYTTFHFLGSEKKSTANQKEERIQAGAIDDFAPGSVTFIPAGQFYLSRLGDGGFLAISRKCSHLGCSVPWVADREQFECPCHASIFDRTGNVIKAPAPRPLDLYSVSFEGFQVVIDLSKPSRRSAFDKGQVAYPGELG
ncbi:MAG: ubiquinol-cytochrome c reductase iron-sulfur subunit [Thermodesulfobacteriota bacterium]